MDIHEKSVDIDMNMDGKFHIHGKPGYRTFCLKFCCHGRGKIQLAAFDGPFAKTSHRCKKISQISLTQANHSQFCPEIRCHGNGGRWGEMRLAAFDGLSPNPPPSIGAKMLQKSFTQAEL